MLDRSDLEQKIGYVFKNKELLEQALTHSSYSNEHEAQDYERLEFLGDALLDYVAADLLFNMYPDKKEGELTKIRAGLVKEDTLSKIADELSLTSYARFSQTKQSNPIAASKAVKCDLFEAVIGAVLIDSNKDMVLLTRMINTFLKPYFNIDYTDYKSQLLELLAQNKLSYRFEFEGSFDPKNPVYRVNLYINDKKVTNGEGQNKRSAERDACKKYFDQLFKK